MKPIIHLLRPVNLLLLAFIFITIKVAVLLPFYQQTKLDIALSWGEYALFCLCIIGITAAGYTVNAIYDVPIDRINCPDKNPVGNGITTQEAWIIYFVINGLCIAGTIYFWNGRLLLLHSIVIIALWAYSYSLKRQFLVGNLLVAALCALATAEAWFFDFPILYAQASQKIFIAQHSLFILIIYIAFAFLTTLLREIIKDIEDMEGDKKARCKTLAIMWGMERTKGLLLGILACLAMALAMELRTFWFYGRMVSVVYVVVMLILPLFYLIYQLRHAQQKAHYTKLSSDLKIYMLLGVGLLWVDFVSGQ